MKINAQVAEVLISMGYRPMDSNRSKWGKPLGFTILFIDLDEMQISQKFHTNLGELATWSRGSLDKDPKEMLEQIKYYEAWEMHKGDIGHATGKAFNFISQEEVLECMIET